MQWLHYLAPLLGIIGYELGEIGGQAGPSYLDRLM